MEDDIQDNDAVEIPIDGTLDLHTFNPREVRELLPAYIDECREHGLHEVRVIHGKGTGMLRETVHSILRKLPGIHSFKLADETGGSWGATIVQLERPTSR
jgi:DNA-nicking Smr family endonuclease